MRGGDARGLLRVPTRVASDHVCVVLPDITYNINIIHSPPERFSPFILRLGVRQTFQSPISSPTVTAIAVDLCGGVMLACYCCAVAYLTTSHA